MQFYTAATSTLYVRTTALDHELRDDSVKDTVLVVERLALFSHSLFSGAKGTEVVHRFGDGVSELRLRVVVWVMQSPGKYIETLKYSHVS
jgi:hypothetical protein